MQARQPGRKDGRVITPCVRILNYVHHQNRRPKDNSIKYWEAFCAEYFAENAVMRLAMNVGPAIPAVQLQAFGGSNGNLRQRSLEAPAEVLPRLFQVKFEGGLLEEQLFLSNANELPAPSGPPGSVMVTCGSAVEESVFEAVRVMRYGQLRVVFTPALKIAVYEFNMVAMDHAFPQTFLALELHSLAQAMQAHRYELGQAGALDQAAAAQVLERTGDAVVQLGKHLDAQLQSVTEHGYVRRFMRCVQIADVVNSMADLFSAVVSSNDGSPLAALQRYGALGGGANVQGFTSSPGDQHSQQTSHPGYGRAGLAMGPPRRSCSSPTAMSAPAQPNHSPPAGCGPALGRTTTPGPGPMPAPHLRPENLQRSHSQPWMADNFPSVSPHYNMQHPTDSHTTV